LLLMDFVGRERSPNCCCLRSTKNHLFAAWILLCIQYPKPLTLVIVCVLCNQRSKILNIIFLTTVNDCPQTPGSVQRRCTTYCPFSSNQYLFSYVGGHCQNSYLKSSIPVLNSLYSKKKAKSIKGIYNSVTARNKFESSNFQAFSRNFVPKKKTERVSLIRNNVDQNQTHPSSST
jgi:hypothetical protein